MIISWAQMHMLRGYAPITPKEANELPAAFKSNFIENIGWLLDTVGWDILSNARNEWLHGYSIVLVAETREITLEGITEWGWEGVIGLTNCLIGEIDKGRSERYHRDYGTVVSLVKR